MNTIPADGKQHYRILDGLRGVAAIMVVAFHLFEGHATSHLDQLLNHGYLAVDFFFVLSGFVIGYAYDDRWKKLTLKDFFKRRIIRLQPMVVMGMVVGGVCLYFQSSPLFPEIAGVPVYYTVLLVIIGSTLLPVPPSMDVRGWGEMHPLNGPGWSLFFEYIANILYAVWIRKFSKTALTVIVVLSGVALLHLAVTSPSGDIIGGWSLTGTQLRIGFTRLLYPFFAGLLLSRVAKPTYIKNAFLWCSLLLIAVLAFPRVGGSEHLWWNGLYDAFSIIVIFPLIIYMGASGVLQGTRAIKVCTFLSDISYPIYITHYPLVYIYMGYIATHKLTLADSYPVAIITFFGAIALAYACLRWYDTPVRNWLNTKFMKSKVVN